MHDITQEELARRIGVSRQTIILIEKGRIKRPSDNIIISIARVFNSEPGDIFFTPLVQHVSQKRKQA
jgi:putative transcriptional regulator